MLRLTHRAFATTCIATYTFYTKNPSDLIMLPMAWLSASIPDLDSIGKRYNIPLLKKIEHRGFLNGLSHSVFPLIGLWYLYRLYPNHLILGTFIGILSHIIADGCSNAGLALFYPFQSYRFYPNGAYHVLGPRFFPNLYKTGDSVLGINIPKDSFISKHLYALWYIITGILILML